MVVSESLNTVLESILSNARDGIWDCYGGQARAFIESIVSNARDGVGHAAIYYRVGNRYAARII